MPSRFSGITETQKPSRFRGIAEPTRYTMPEEIADKFILSDKPIHAWYPQEQAEVAKSILDSVQNPTDIDAKNKNVIYMSSLFNIDTLDAAKLHDQLSEAMFDKKNMPAVAILNQIKEHEVKRKTLKQTVADGYSQAGVNMVKSLAGLVRMDLEAQKMIYDKLDLPIPYDPLGFKAKLEEWSRVMQEGVRTYYEENPDEATQIIPGRGFMGTARQYIERPENIVQGSVEAVPMMLQAALGSMTGTALAPAAEHGAKLLPWMGRVFGMAGPIAGAGYEDDRNSDIPPEIALPKNLLIATIEGIIEEWTLGQKVKVFQGVSGLAARKGMAGTAANILLGFPRGVAEEGTQRLNQNFWNMVFSDPDQKLLEGVGESAAAGGFVEMAMTGGFKSAGMAYNNIRPETVMPKSREIQSMIEDMPMTEPSKQEAKTEVAKASIEAITGTPVENIEDLGLTPDEISALESDEVEEVAKQAVETAEIPPESTPAETKEAEPTPEGVEAETPQIEPQAEPTYKELQVKAKELGIKANQKKADLQQQIAEAEQPPAEKPKIERYPTDGKLADLEREALSFKKFEDWVKYEKEESFGREFPKKEVSKVLTSGSNLLPSGKDLRYEDAKIALKEWAGDISDHEAMRAFWNAVKLNKMRGKEVKTPKPAEKQGELSRFLKEEKGGLDIETLNDMSEEAKNNTIKFGRGVNSVVKSAAEKASFQLENINPKLFGFAREHALSKLQNTHWSLRRSEKLVKGLRHLKRINRKAYKEFSYYLKKNDWAKMTELAAKHGLTEDFNDVIKLLQDIYPRAESAGIRIEFREGFFPRMVKDMQKLQEIITGIPGMDKSVINDALKERAKRTGRDVDELTDREISDAINTLIRGYPWQGVKVGRPGHAKERQIVDYTREIDKAYYSAEEGLVKYIEQMESAIAEYTFFGRINPEVRNLRKRESYYRDRVSALTKLKSLSVPEQHEKIDGKIFDAQQKLESVLKQQEETDMSERPTSIGDVVRDLVLNDEIQIGQEKELQDVLRAYFNPVPQNVLVRNGMSLTYLLALGNSLLHNLTQLGEVSNAILESPDLAIPATAKVLLRKEIVTHEDIPHRLFSEELNLGGGASKFVNRVLRLTLGVDDFGKAVHRNTAALKAFRLSAKENPAFIEELKLYFGDQWQTALENMKTGEKSDFIVKYAFNRVSDRQPLTGLEMPVLYHTQPNLRPFLYMFRSFQLNRLNSIIQNTRRYIKNGHYAKAVGTLAIAIAVYLASDIPPDILKDIIRGKKVEEDDIDDYVFDNMLRMVFMSKYMVDSFDYKNPSEVIMKNVTPGGFSVIDDTVRSIKNDDYTRLEKYIPLVGTEIYEYGKKDSKKRTKKTRKKRKR